MGNETLKFRVAVAGGWIGSNGYMCDVVVDGAKVATSRPQFAALFATREEAMKVMRIGARIETVSSASGYVKAVTQ